MKSPLWRLVWWCHGQLLGWSMVFITAKHSLPTPPPDLPLLLFAPEQGRLIPCAGRSKPYLLMSLASFFLFWNKEAPKRKIVKPWHTPGHPCHLSQSKHSPPHDFNIERTCLWIWAPSITNQPFNFPLAPFPPEARAWMESLSRPAEWSPGANTGLNP